MNKGEFRVQPTSLFGGEKQKRGTMWHNCIGVGRCTVSAIHDEPGILS